MTTKSMHKPGWRTRRRSKLTLVERAVPRLGHMPPPKDLDKPSTSENVAAESVAADTVAEETEQRETSLHTEQDFAGTAAVEVHPFDANDPASSPVAPEPAAGIVEATVEASSPERSDEVSARAGFDDGWAAQADKASEAVDNDRSIGLTDRLAPASDPDPVPIENAVVVETAGPDPDRSEAAVPPLVPASVSAAAEALSRRLATDEAPASDMPVAPEKTSIAPEKTSIARAPADHGVLKLDWEHLTTEGFVDPRQGRDKLPANMQEIVHALIRQAMSDQSSWRDRVILVTSPNERTAKTTASITFALGLATAKEHKVVLADVDTSGPGAVARLGGKNASGGICAALADETIPIADLEIGTELDQLTLVASGTPDKGTFDRFASRRMLQILRYLTADPKTLLIIDAPPILASQEAAVLSVVAGQVVLAVEAGSTTGDSIEHALQRIGERHNVSLVLTESSGFEREPNGRAEPAKEAHVPAVPNRRAPSSKRRPANVAAAAAGAAALLGLLVVNSPSLARPVMTFASDLMPTLMERWSPEVHRPAVDAVQMDR